MFDYPVLVIFPLAMAYAAVMDVFTMTIPNRVSLALIAGFFGAAILGAMPLIDILKHLGVGLAVLAVAIFMFYQRWVGGGDAKLLAAASLWFGVEQIGDYMFMVAMFGGLLSLFFMSFRSFIPPVLIAGRDWAERLHDKNAGIPYGVALAAAGLWVYPNSDIFRAFWA